MQPTLFAVQTLQHNIFFAPYFYTLSSLFRCTSDGAWSDLARTACPSEVRPRSMESPCKEALKPLIINVKRVDEE